MHAPAKPVDRLIDTLIVPAVFDFWAQKLNRTFSWERCLARVVERRVEARNTVTLVLQANRHFSGYQPGQHLNLSVEVDGVRLTRCYSPVTLPDKRRRFSVTVRKEPGGRVSTHLVDRIRVGDVIEVGPGDAFGGWAVPDHSDAAPWVLVAGGSGITPVWCLAQALLEGNSQTAVHLYYWVRQREDLCFVGALSDALARFANFSVTVVFTGDKPVLPGEMAGRPTAEHFHELGENLSRCHLRVCGSEGFVASVEGLLADKVTDCCSESFSRPMVSAIPGERVNVTLARSGRQLQLPSGVSLLEGLEQAGLSPAYGCRRGICNTCVCEKHKGVTRHLVDGSEHDEAGPVRLCTAAPQTDITLEL